MARKLLLWCGIMAAMLYIAMNAFVPMLWHGYSSLSHTVSELSALGAPTRPLWVILGTMYSLLVIAFGWGVCLAAGRTRLLRVVGGLMIANGVFALAWPPMHLRPVLAAGGATLTDTLHIAWTIATGLFMTAEVGLAAVVFGRRFRLYSIATLVVVLTCGVLAGLDAPRVQANLPTPWVGLWERVNILAYMLWIVALSMMMLRRGSTPSFRTATDEPTPGSVAEISYETLGGVDQWVMVRGQNVSNPVLIVLHGGPGMSESAFFRYYNAPLERSFTVVHWDQRGAGKSFDAAIPRDSMTVDRFVADLDELVDRMRMRFNQQKVAILGHSWGTVVGALYAARFPEKVSVYIGSAQIGDWLASESASYAYALAEAQRLNKGSALRALRAIGPPPYGVEAVMTERTWLQRFAGQLSPRALWDIVRIVFTLPETSIVDLPSVVRGFRFTLGAMWNDVQRLNLLKLVPSLRVPVFFFLGRLDHWVPAETSVAYFDALVAPSKRIVWFEKSGHEMFMDEPAKFNATMAELVRPVAAVPLAA